MHRSDRRCVSGDLEWPGQTVAWLADVEGELTKLALGTRTNETEPSTSEVTVVSE